MTATNAGIIGMGHAYPSGILTNADLEKMVETSDDWITTRTGIKQRHKAAENEYTSQFGTLAARRRVRVTTRGFSASTGGAAMPRQAVCVSVPP